MGAQTPFQSGEEVDLILRVIRAGAVVRYVPDLRIHHDQVAAVFGAAQIERARRYAPGFGRVLRLHDYGLGYLAYRLARTCFGACVALGRGDLQKMRY